MKTQLDKAKSDFVRQVNQFIIWKDSINTLSIQGNVVYIKPFTYLDGYIDGIKSNLPVEDINDYVEFTKDYLDIYIPFHIKHFVENNKEE